MPASPLSTTQTEVFMPYMRDVGRCERSLQELNLMWRIIEASAKMNCPQEARAILPTMAATRSSFAKLEKELVRSLVQEKVSHVLTEIGTKAQYVIDIVVRNLFERTADVGFLASDGPLCAHAALDPSDPAHAASREALQARFAAYAAKYSVYDDIVLLSPQGEVLARLDTRLDHASCREPWVAEALASEAPYVEHHGPTPLLGGRHGLIYARPLRGPDGVLGLLCLSFRLADEMAAIFRQLLTGQDAHAVICLLDADRRVLHSSDAWQLPPGAQLVAGGERLLFAGREYLCASATASGYEGYMGPPGWSACVLTPLEWAFEAPHASTGPGADDAALTGLRRLAGPHAGWLAQGAAFAAKARLHAGNPTADTERGCRALCGCDAATAAAATDRALQALPADGPEPAYALWRHRIHALLRPRSEEPVPC